MFPNSEQPTTAVFKDTSYFIDGKKCRLCMVPSLDLSLDRGKSLSLSVCIGIKNSVKY